MDIRQLKYFIAVAEEQHIRRAADRLHISQPPLTRQIHALEAELGVLLFTRTKWGVKLTQVGEYLLDHARDIKAHVELVKHAYQEIEDILSARDQTLAMILRVGQAKPATDYSSKLPIQVQYKPTP